MGFRRALSRGRIREDRGAYAILFVIIVVAMFTMIAIVVDLSSARAQVRNNQSTSDFAALAAANHLPGDPVGACAAAWAYVRSNIPGLPALPSPCSPPNPAFPAACNALTPAQDYVAQSGNFLITFRYPIPDGDPALAGPARSVDGTDPCARFAVTIRTRITTLFGGITGAQALSAPASAVSRGELITRGGDAVALLILDPHGCQSIQTGAQGTVIHVFGNQTKSGIISVDSDGTQCADNNPNGYTIYTNSTSATRKIAADDAEIVDSKGVIEKGLIRLFAMIPGQTLCVASTSGLPGRHACDPADITNGRIVPQPTPATKRATRAPVDYTYNCKASYPTFIEAAISTAKCSSVTADNDSDGIPDSAYIDELTLKTGSTNGGDINVPPTGFTPLCGTASGPCSTLPSAIPAGVTGNTRAARCNSIGGATATFKGNWFIDCNSDITISGNLTFATGNVVWQNGIQVTGTLSMNTSNVTADNPQHLSTSCYDPTNGIVKVCPTDYAQTGAFLYLRNSSFGSSTGGAVVNLQHVMMFLRVGTLQINATGGTTTMNAPTEGAFRNLAAWSDPGVLQNVQSPNSIHAKPRLGAGGVVKAEGVFFFPYGAPFNYGGSGNANIPDNAQFITYDLNVDGGGELAMKPDPNRVVTFFLQEMILIR